MWGICKCSHSSLAGVLSHRHKPSAQSALVTPVFSPAQQQLALFILWLLIYCICVNTLFQETPLFIFQKYITHAITLMQVNPSFVIRWRFEADRLQPPWCSLWCIYPPPPQKGQNSSECHKDLQGPGGNTVLIINCQKLGVGAVFRGNTSQKRLVRPGKSSALCFRPQTAYLKWSSMDQWRSFFIENVILQTCSVSAIGLGYILFLLTQSLK